MSSSRGNMQVTPRTLARNPLWRFALPAGEQRAMHGHRLRAVLDAARGTEPARSRSGLSGSRWLPAAAGNRGTDQAVTASSRHMRP